MYRGFDNPSYHATRQNHHHQAKAATYYEADHSPTSPPPIIYTNNERAKSVDYSRISLNEARPMSSSTYTSNVTSPTTTSRSSRATNARPNRTTDTRSSIVYIDEIRSAQEEGEKQELNILNSRFGNYLDKIKHLATVNTNLRRQVDDAYRKYMGHIDGQLIENNNNNKTKIYQHPSEIKLNNLRKQINDEVHAQTLIQIRLQRADYDIKFYQKNIKILTAHDQKQTEQIRVMRQQLEANILELDQLKRQYERRGQDLQMYKSQYDEYMNKLMEFSKEYDNISYERMENENNLYTLKEQLSFEQEYYQRRQQEFEYLEKFQYDFNKEFNKNEFHNIVKQIRQDYQEFNAIHITELENLYKTKLETVRNEFIKRDKQQQQQETSKPREICVELDSTKKEHRALVEQNLLLKNNLEQLEQDFNNIIEQNRQHYDVTDKEYKQLQNEIPELDCIIVHLRDSAVSLWSEINTYRYLLLNLLSTTNEKSSHLSIPNEQKKVPIEKYITTDKHFQEPIINKLTTVGTKTKPLQQQYRDETTGFTVHIEDGIIWVRI